MCCGLTEEAFKSARESTETAHREETCGIDQSVLTGGCDIGVLLSRKSAVQFDREEVQRVVLEVCGGPDSLMSRPGPYTIECRCVRITISIDFASRRGLCFAINVLRVYRSKVLVWFSMPCTGGCPFQYLNYKKSAKAKQRIDMQHLLFRLLWQNAVKVIAEARMVEACVANEWPNQCSYWKRREVIDLIAEYSLVKTVFHGCQYGLTSIRKRALGLPILKSWAVVTDCVPLITLLDKKCQGEYTKGFHDDSTRHVVCEGEDTKASEQYTEHIVQCVHIAHRKHLNLQHS